MSKIMAIFAIVAALLLSVGGSAMAAPAPTPITDVTGAYYDDGLAYYYFTSSGKQTNAEGAYQIKIALSNRIGTGVVGGLPQQADGRAGITKYRPYPEIGNVQVNSVTLYANNGTVRARGGTVNSNGGNSAYSNTNTICVSPFGSGSYYSQATFSWRYGLGQDLFTVTVRNFNTQAKFATC